MSVNLTDACCRNRLKVSEARIDEFKAYTERTFGPIGWQEGDERIGRHDGSAYRVLPCLRHRPAFYVGGGMPDSYGDDLAGMLSLCEPGSFLEVMEVETNHIEHYSVRADGSVVRIGADLINPFCLFCSFAPSEVLLDGRRM